MLEQPRVKIDIASVSQSHSPDGLYSAAQRLPIKQDSSSLGFDASVIRDVNRIKRRTNCSTSSSTSRWVLAQAHSRPKSIHCL